MSMVASGRKEERVERTPRPNRNSGAAVAPYIRSVCLPPRQPMRGVARAGASSVRSLYPYDLATPIARQVGDVFLVHIRRRGRRWCRKPGVLQAWFRGGDLSVEPRQPKQQRQCTMPRSNFVVVSSLLKPGFQAIEIAAANGHFSLISEETRKLRVMPLSGTSLHLGRRHDQAEA